MPTANYLAEASQPAKKVQWMVEIELDRCDNQYTQSPCTASDAGDGMRCHYSFATCQDPDNFVRTTRVYRFCLADVPWSDDTVQVWPFLKRVVPTPQEVKSDKLSVFPEKLRLTMTRDFLPPPIDHDKGTGFHNTQRVGEFFALLKARNPNYPGRPVRIYRGFSKPEGFALADFEKIGPTYELIGMKVGVGEVTVECESPLARLDKREIPLSTSDDNLIIDTGGINASVTTVTVVDAGEIPDPTAYTRNRIYVEVENEIMEVTARDTGTDELTVVRGAFGTTAASHAEGLPVKHLVCFGRSDGSGLPGKIVSFLQDLLEWAGIDVADIDASSFDEVQETVWPSDDSRRILRRPIKVSKLAQEIRDPRGVLLLIGASGKWVAEVYGPSTATETLTDEHFVRDSVEVDEKDEDRITRVLWFYNPSEEDTGASQRYTRVVAVVNSELESANSYGKEREGKITDAWMDSSIAVGTIRNVARRLLTRRRNGSRRFTFRLEVRDGTELNVGDARTIQTARHIDANGNQEPRPVLITKKKEIGRGVIEYEAADSAFAGPFLRMGPDTMTDDYDSASMADKEFGYWGDVNNRLGTLQVPGYVYF